MNCTKLSPTHWKQLCRSKYLEWPFQADCYSSSCSNMAVLPLTKAALQTERKVHWSKRLCHRTLSSHKTNLEKKKRAVRGTDFHRQISNSKMHCFVLSKFQICKQFFLKKISVSSFSIKWHINYPCRYLFQNPHGYLNPRIHRHLPAIQKQGKSDPHASWGPLSQAEITESIQSLLASDWTL